MVKNHKWHVLLCAFAIVAAMLITMFAVSSCSCEDTSLTTTDTTSGTSTPTTPPVGAGEYTRVDFAGTQINSTTSSGVVGDLSGYTSVNGIVTLGDSLYVSDETGKHVYKLSLSGEVQKTYTATTQVNNVVTDGTNVYALVGGLDGAVVKLSAELEVVATVSVGHTPKDMAVAGAKGYVANRFSGTVSVINLADMTVASTVEIEGREPASVVTVGTDVYVACHLPDEASTADVMSANVVIISTSTDTITKNIPLINGTSGVKDICVSPDGKTVYVSHVLGRYTYPVTQMDRGWINTNAITIIDTTKQEITCSCLLDEVDHGAANPWGITVSADGKYLCVALAGTDEVMVITISKMNAEIAKVVDKTTGRKVETVAEIIDYLPFLDGCRERVTVGTGVRSLVEKDGVLYAGLYFDGTVAAVKLSDLSVSTLSVATQPENSLVRAGQILWFDATQCYQNWQSCSSCHPDAFSDGLVWDFTGNGWGNAFNSKSPIMAYRTPPVTFNGGVVDAEEEIVISVLGDLYNASFTDEQHKAFDAFLMSLLPTASPALKTDGTLTESATAGKALFEANCASCHPAPLYTDMKLHNVGTDASGGVDGQFDTPSLLEAWRTGPYMHDGSLYTIEEVVKFFAKNLSDTEVKQLADYVRSICAVGEQYGVEQVRGTKADGTETYNLYIEGVQLKTVSVRKQAENAAETVVIALNVYDKDGKQVYYTDGIVTGLNNNSTAVITLDNGITLPEGGSYTISIYDTANGNPVATTLTIK